MGPKTIEAFFKLIAEHPQLAELDVAAFVRILERWVAKGTTQSGVLGQLVEELFWAKFIGPLAKVSQRWKAAKLGINPQLIKEGWEIVVIEGHRVSDAWGPLTDGFAALRKAGEPLRVVKIFEVKAYVEGAKKIIGMTANSLKGLAPEAARIVRYRAKLVWEEAQALFAKGLGPPPPPIQDVEEAVFKVVQREESQVTNAIERMTKGTVEVNGELKSGHILIDGEAVAVRVDETCQFWGITPRDVGLGVGGPFQAAFTKAEDVLESRGVNFIHVTLGLSRPEIDVLVKAFVDLAKLVAGG
jgi:predicted Fe-Mo cluster-binding NifX family protein